MNIIPICAITDENQPFAMVTTLISALENANEGTFYNFYCFITGGVSILDREKILLLKDLYPNKCSVELIDMGEKYSDVNRTHRYITHACLYKFEIIEKLTNYDKVIYLDSDLIVREDLTELYNKDLSDNYLGAVLNVKKICLYPEMTKYLEIPDLKTFFNAGVLLMNLKKLREDNLLNELKKYIGHYQGSVEQSIFNKVCYAKVLLLEPKFNVMYSFCDYYSTVKNPEYIYTKEQTKEALSFPIIYHYAIDEKPWDYYGMPYGKEWSRYYKKSSYSGIKLKRRNFAIRMLLKKIFKFFRIGGNRIYHIIKKRSNFIKKAFKK